MNAHERRLFAALLALAEDAGVGPPEHRHRAIIATQEGHGHCQHYETGGVPVKRGQGFRLEQRTHVDLCGPRCKAWAATLDEARAVLASDQAQGSEQLRLLEAV